MIPVAVFLLSGDVSQEGHATACDALENRGFEVFATRLLSDQLVKLLPNSFGRDGNALIAFNPLMSAQEPRKNAVFAEREVEKAAHLLATTLLNPASQLRVTQNAVQASQLAKSLLTPAQWSQLQTQIDARQKEMATDVPVLADLSRFKYRAKVELVTWNGQTAIKKTFRSSARAAMERELAFYNAIAPYSDIPARILDQTENALIYEFIENQLKTIRVFGLRLPNPLPLARVRELAEFTHLVAGRGWDPIDLTPRDNVLIDGKTGRLRAIDFEFAHQRDSAVPPVEAYFLSGVPQRSTAARPLNNEMNKDPYPGKWQPFTGLSKASFLYDPLWLQRLKRVLVHPVWLALYLPGALRRRRRHSTERDDLLASVVLHGSPVEGQSCE